MKFKIELEMVVLIIFNIYIYIYEGCHLYFAIREQQQKLII